MRSLAHARVTFHVLHITSHVVLLSFQRLKTTVIDRDFVGLSPGFIEAQSEGLRMYLDVLVPRGTTVHTSPLHATIHRIDITDNPK